MLKFLTYGLGGAGLFLLVCIVSGPAPAPTELNTPAKLQSAAQIVQAHGFDCLRATEVRDGFWSGFRVECDGAAGRKYHYGIDDEGGRWHVEFRY